MAVTITNYPLCCGIYILQGFSNYDSSNTHDVKTTEKQIETLLRTKNQTGLYLAAMNHYQKDAYGKMMERLGFQAVVNDFLNPIHGSTITLYGKALYGTDQKPDIVPKMNKSSIFQNVSNYY